MADPDPNPFEVDVKPFNGPFIRSVEGENLLEIFFVTAVASVLGIRFFLAITGYPQLSGKGLHIAHVLLGGLLMMLAITITLAYINKSAHYVAAFLGGFGFGAFIDELGKFITGDNDYFYKPTVALIYVTFVLLYLGIEAFVRRPTLTSQERLINVLEITKEVALGDLDHRERKKALELLKECNPHRPRGQGAEDSPIRHRGSASSEARHLHQGQISRSKALQKAGAKKLVRKRCYRLLSLAVFLCPGAGYLSDLHQAPLEDRSACRLSHALFHRFSRAGVCNARSSFSNSCNTEDAKEQA
jgi:hypothetical protein